MKNYLRSEKSLNHSSRTSQEPHGQSCSAQSGGHIRKANISQGHKEKEGSQKHWEKAGSGSQNRSKSTWRPIREVLNVDTVLNELEQRRQQQQDSPRCSKPSSQDRAHTEPSKEHEREHARTREDRKQKCLMTIYEDEQRHETESHSSVESESRVSQQKGSRLKGVPKTLLRSDTWTIQRTESGYESSDRLSSGSTNPDSPGVDGFGLRPDQRLTPEVILQRSKHTSNISRKAKCSEKNSAGSEGKQSEHQEPANCRGHGGENTAPGHITKTSSSEWNSSDDLVLSESEDRESTYLSSNSEAVTSDSPCPHIDLTYHPPSSVTAETQLGATGSPHLRPNQQASPHHGESSHAVFRPRMLQEPFPSSPRLSPSSHISPKRRPDISSLRTFSDASSKSGSDPERSTQSSCESEERLPGGRADEAAQAPEVSLTTYFNVDNCMTETYRLKYHNQRPLVLSATVPRTVAESERRDNSHTLPSDAQSHDVPKAWPETSKT
ncbi:hypothetical protein XENOCAPTIV_015979 [Xenoophorus captivus]|uniref:Uncharacterized protein n=1 Tax=Xenoophorus captivus TaxID=1517983 RepID=A0ABV0QLZ8_9TELE